MAIAKSPDMDEATFFAKARDVCAWFEPLNPYEQKGSLFKIEDANFALGKESKAQTLAPLYSYCISSKRYVLLNLSASDEPIIRKASAHGLGHLLPPYGEDKAPPSIPAPKMLLSEIGVERWQYDLWYQIVCADLAGHPDQVDLSYHISLEGPAASRYGATTPDLLRWFKPWNKNRPYPEQVKTFNFLVAFQSRPQLILSDLEATAVRKKGPKPEIRQAKPVAPYDKDMRAASRRAFDREAGKPVPPETLKSYREALAQYHLSPESKFLNGDYLDRGRTERRHIQTTAVVHIGKEANRWEEQLFTGFGEETQIEYGMDTADRFADQHIRQMCKELGERETASEMKISRMALRKALSAGLHSLSPSLRNRIARNCGS